jgi:hypothetical protein
MMAIVVTKILSHVLLRKNSLSKLILILGWLLSLISSVCVCLQCCFQKKRKYIHIPETFLK